MRSGLFQLVSNRVYTELRNPSDLGALLRYSFAVRLNAREQWAECPDLESARVVVAMSARRGVLICAVAGTRSCAGRNGGTAPV